MERLFEERIRTVETTVTEKRYGQAEVLVRIVADRPWQAEAFFYKFYRDGGRWRQYEPGNSNPKR